MLFCAQGISGKTKSDDPDARGKKTTDVSKHLTTSNIVMPATLAEALVEKGFDVDVAKTEKTPQHA